jgi:hypothetical protein
MRFQVLMQLYRTNSYFKWSRTHFNKQGATEKPNE